MKLTHRFKELAAEKRPRDPHLDGDRPSVREAGSRRRYPDTMPQAVKLSDAEGRSCIYVPITQNGKGVDRKGQSLDLEE
jgi:hypothetical protein